MSLSPSPSSNDSMTVLANSASGSRSLTGASRKAYVAAACSKTWFRSTPLTASEAAPERRPLAGLLPLGLSGRDLLGRDEPAPEQRLHDAVLDVGVGLVLGDRGSGPADRPSDRRVGGAGGGRRAGHPGGVRPLGGDDGRGARRRRKRWHGRREAVREDGGGRAGRSGYPPMPIISFEDGRMRAVSAERTVRKPTMSPMNRPTNVWIVSTAVFSFSDVSRS